MDTAKRSDEVKDALVDGQIAFGEGKSTSVEDSFYSASSVGKDCRSQSMIGVPARKVLRMRQLANDCDTKDDNQISLYNASTLRIQEFPA
jgi:hypothetical protein